MKEPKASELDSIIKYLMPGIPMETREPSVAKQLASFNQSKLEQARADIKQLFQSLIDKSQVTERAPSERLNMLRQLVEDL